jgi:hypothetical protein
MENTPQDDWRKNRFDWQREKGNGRIVFGAIIAGFGLLMLLKMFNVLPPILYSVHFGWPLILIVVGFVIGLKSNFRNNAWWILTLIGGVHLLPPFYIGDVASRRLIWPFLLLAAGLAMVLRKKRTCPTPSYKHHGPFISNDADTLNIDVTFGGRKEIVTSRNFKGGIVRATFAGVEINLAAADSEIQPMILEVHASFSGIEIIVPSHWKIQNEVNPTMGSVEDQRMVRTHDIGDAKHTLILRGSCSFASIEIKSY